MKSIRKTLGISLITLTTMALVATSAYADGRGCRQGSGFGNSPGTGKGVGPDKGLRAEKLARRLGLSDGQKLQIETILETSQAEREAAREKLQESREALQEATHKQPYDASLVRTLADQQGDLKADMIVFHANDRSQISGVLTKAQQEEFNQMRQHRKHRKGMNRD